MFGRHWLIVGCVAFGAAGAHASYEMLITASTSGTFYRYDLENRISLGTFSNFQCKNVTSMTSIASANRTYASDSFGRIHRFNHFTGEYLGSFVSGKSGIKQLSPMANGNILVTDATTIGVFNPTTGTLVTNVVLVAGDTPVGAVQLPDLSFASFSYIAGRSYYRNLHTASGLLNISSQFQVGVSAANEYVGVGLDGSDLIVWGKTQSAYAAGSFKRVSSTVALTSSSITSSALGSDEAFISSNSARTHSGRWVNVQDFQSISSSARAVYFIEPQTNTVELVGGFGWSGGKVAGVSTILAPEPGTWLAMGAGLVLIARRRKAR